MKWFTSFLLQRRIEPNRFLAQYRERVEQIASEHHLRHASHSVPWYDSKARSTVTICAELMPETSLLDLARAEMRLKALFGCEVEVQVHRPDHSTRHIYFSRGRPTHVQPIEHIARAAEQIFSYVEGLNFTSFMSSRLVQDAVLWNLGVVGEAARTIERLHPQFAKAHEYIPWRGMYEMRNRIVHGYASVDLELVWMTVERDLPALYEQIKAMRSVIEYAR